MRCMSDVDLDVSQPYNRNALDIPFGYVVDLVLRRTLVEETTSVLRLSRTLGLGLGVVEEAFEELRGKKYLDVKTLQGNDYVFCLTQVGREQAKERYIFSQYTGVAPVALDTYLKAVHLQKSAIKVNRDALRIAMGDLVVEQAMLDQLGPAFNSQHSIFFYGPAGTGKTSLAERLVRLYPDWIVIPRSVLVDGQIIQIFDPVVHEPLPEQPDSLDPRWMACKRPLVTVGGEMDPGSLDLHYDPQAGIYTAPIQVKANNGMLLIDDFGRQVMTPEQLLNRWIYPLAKRMDFLRLANGTKFAMPFELMVVFSTNMDPSDLGDEAFFRRIQNKVYVGPVTAEVFDRILALAAPKIGVQMFQGSAEIMKKICLERDAIGLRANYPWDLCKMIKSVCEYEERRAVLDPPTLARAAQLYWGQFGAKMSAVKTNRGSVGGTPKPAAPPAEMGSRPPDSIDPATPPSTAPAPAQRIDDLVTRSNGALSSPTMSAAPSVQPVMTAPHTMPSPLPLPAAQVVEPGVHPALVDASARSGAYPPGPADHLSREAFVLGPSTNG